ncbi:MAG: hypothetical protein ABI690_19440 [Chloroflexota bacterium]
MHRLSILFSLAIITLIVIPVQAQEVDIASVQATCPDGTEITNGAEIRVNMRPGFTYTATAIGINGFDPIIAVRDEHGVQACNDDEPKAADYEVNLPTTGRIAASDTSAQLPFSHHTSSFADISIIVGGFEGATGEFVLILEGMAVTGADGHGEGAGDPFAVHLTQNMVNSGVPLTLYMMAKRNDLDPYMQFVGTDNKVITLDDGTKIECDDAGDTQSCFGDSSDLSKASVNTTQGRSSDAMMSIPLAGFTLDSDTKLNFFNYLMTSYNQSSFGEYMVAFHVGVGEGTAPANNGDKPPIIPTPSSTKPQKGALTLGSSGGIELTCLDGTAITNGAEIVLYMARGTTYTATAIGMGDFDPIIAVQTPDGKFECFDDTPAASNYSANLPTTGFIRKADSSAQVEISQNSEDYANIAVIVGGFEGASGQFVLVVEGTEVSPDDGLGDGYAVRISPNLISSGVPLSVYMLGVQDALDPFLQMVNADGSPILLRDGTPVECDDAGDPSICSGKSRSLVGSFVTGAGNRQVKGREGSAMLTIPIDGFDPNADVNVSFLNFALTSYEQQSIGDYLVVFHIGVGTGAAPDTQSNI